MKDGGAPDAVDGDGGGDAGHPANAARITAAAATLAPAMTTTRIGKDIHPQEGRRSLRSSDN
jgi:hypothetical protein